MLDEVLRKTIQQFCLNNINLNYYDLIVFIEQHIKETQILIKRSLTKQEIIELTLNALKLLSLNKYQTIPTIRFDHQTIKLK